ncbi:malto-oligosyltrehalose synthase [Euzebya tangerina]|uniref:malto-oligosyltrehalose synthase n=1 Tax=Euzebya tangerina TaxID=591198 RepID=UPI000E31F8A5|nr:malto-oligosyltrehalose synthase [Euzebya tangerina]
MTSADVTSADVTRADVTSADATDAEASHSTMPQATYRLQLTADHPFAEAAALVPYLARLGVSHLYVSPILAARPGTRHFYNVADHGKIDPVLGGYEGLVELAETAHAAGLGLIGDIVPNHMGIGQWNSRWETLLREGQSSQDAKFFDIDWETPLPGAAGKVILPVLERPYGEELAAGNLGLQEIDGELRVTYDTLTFPLNAETTRAVERSGSERLVGTPGEPRSWSRMHSLLEQQHYRLVGWKAGKRLINYRRFLHITELAALRVEDPVVFEATNGLMIKLVTDGLLDGLRVDHIDGLADPTEYLTRLRNRVGPDAWLVVEKLARPDEPLDVRWPVDGTTGYELLRVALGVHLDADGMAELRRLAARHGALPGENDLMVLKQVMVEEHLGPDVRRLARVTWNACQQSNDVRDVDYRTLLEAVSRLLVAMPVYRTYVDAETGQASGRTVEIIERAVASAKAADSGDTIPDVLWRYLSRLFSGQMPRAIAASEAITRFQQISGPVMALGVEERLFLRHNAMVAACELGSDPFEPALDLDEAWEAIQLLPDRGMRTTASHDTKHAEDVRQRMAALSGMAQRFSALADEVLAATDPPLASLGLRLLQVAVGVWPITDDGSGDLTEILDVPDLHRRFTEYALRVARGQNILTSYTEKEPEAEAAVRQWCDRVFDPDGPIAGRLRPLAVAAAEIGMVASLSQIMLRLATGGTADTYQGTERWDDSLSDPDNRRSFDYTDRRDAEERWSQSTPDLEELWANRRNGEVKQWVLGQALRARRAHWSVFEPGSTLHRCAVTGRWSDSLLVGHRSAADDGDQCQAVVIAPVSLGRLTDGGRFPALGRVWGDTAATLPPLTEGRVWRDALTGATLEGGDTTRIATILTSLPVALLIADLP